MIHIEKPAEAFAAIAWIVCCADKSGTAEELLYLYEHVRTLDVFEDCTHVEFQSLMGAAFSGIFRTLPDGGYDIPEADVARVIQTVHDALTPALREDAFRMAVGIADADSLCDVEEAVLEQLQAGLAIDDTAAQAILDQSQVAC